MEQPDRKRQREDDVVEDHARPEFESKRQRDDPTAELISSVCKDIRRLGETSNLQTQVDDMSYISNPIVVEFEKIDALRQAVLSTIHAIVVEQPQKITSLATFLLICNAKNFLVLKYIVEFFHTKLQEYLNATESVDNFNNIKNILKFLASLAPAIEEGALKSVFLQFLQAAVDLGRSSLGNEIYYNTLIAIPYLLSYDDSHAEDVKELLSFAEKFPQQDEDAHLLYSHFDSKQGNVEVPYTQKRLVDLVLPALQEGSAQSIFIDYKSLIEPVIAQSLKANGISDQFIKHKVPQLALNTDALKTYVPKLTSSIDYLWFTGPRLTFELYNYTSTEFETLPKITSLPGLLFRDVCTDLITNLSFNKTEASIQLSILDLYFDRLLFCPPGSSIDTLGEIHKDNVSGENTPALSTWKIEDVTVESILSLIFLTPTPPNLEIYYHSVLIACCKENPEAIAPVFGRAIRFLYNSLGSLDFETRIKFLDWMTLQISNFDFSWKWDEWVNDSQVYSASKCHPKKYFIQNLITKELKLSSKKKIKESFVTVDPDTGDVVELDEFFKYLELKLFPQDTKYIIGYDTELYGNDDAIKEIIAKTLYEKKEKITVNTSAQTQMVHVFSNDKLPYFAICDKFNKFLLSNSKSKKEFYETIEEVKNDLTSDNINKLKFIVNLVIQAYCSIGSRSIYSTISILSRDMAKLKWITGNTLLEEDYVGTPDDFRFPALSLQNSEELYTEIQNYVVDAVLRIWVYHPQFVFLILEFLVDLKILDFSVFVDRCFGLTDSFVIERIDCFESLSRILETGVRKQGSEEPKDNYLAKYVSIVSSKIIGILSEILVKLEVPEDQIVTITEFSEEKVDSIDLEWLFYDYFDLFKWLVRKYGNVEGFKDEASTLIDLTKNQKLKDMLNGCLAQRV